MIAMVRVDSRLIHGQVVSMWIPRLLVDRVVVIDGEAAILPIMRAAMEMALPRSVSLTVSSPEVAAHSWDALRDLPGRALILVAGVREAALVVDGLLGVGAEVGVLNLGNLHHEPGRRAITPSLFLSQEELGILQRIASLGVVVEARALPDEVGVGLSEIARRFGDCS